MGETLPDYTDLRIKHLEMIQGVIARMSSSSGTIKRYAVVIAAAAISFGKFAGSSAILLAAAVIVVVFALLDARYLRLERSFRDLFNDVRVEPVHTRPDFRLTPDSNGHGLLEVLQSWSVVGLYLALVVFMFVAIPFIGD